MKFAQVTNYARPSILFQLRDSLYTSRASCHVSQNHDSNVEEIISSVARQFDLDQLKPKQVEVEVEVILAFVGGRDVFVSLPTGYWLFMLLFHLF